MLSTVGVGLLLALVNLCPKQIKNICSSWKPKRSRPNNQLVETQIFFETQSFLSNNPKPVFCYSKLDDKSLIHSQRYTLANYPCYHGNITNKLMKMSNFTIFDIKCPIKIIVKYNFTIFNIQFE